MAIDRTEFLQMCQKVSALECKNVPPELLVVYNGVKYYPYGYEMTFITGTPVHTAILHDMHSGKGSACACGAAGENADF